MLQLSPDYDTAVKVGKRHGRPFIFKVAAKEMNSDGYDFYLSVNDVWLTKIVPPKYLICEYTPAYRFRIINLSQ